MGKRLYLAMKIDTIIKLANLYYRWVKLGVPLGDVINPPGGTYHHPELEGNEEASRKNVTSPLDQGEMDLPPIKEFRKRFEGTSFKYQIIYTGFTFGLTLDTQISVGNFLTWIKNFIKRHEGYQLPEELENQLQQAKYFVEHWDEIFKTDAINIIANKFEADDLISPEGLMHDIGHSLTDDFRYGGSMKDILYGDNLIRAICQDYKVFKNGKEISMMEALKNFSESRGMITSGGWLAKIILTKNNLVSGSIGEYNLRRGSTEDLLPDLFVHYNLGGESFSHLKLVGISFYAANEYLYRFKVSDTLINYQEDEGKRDVYYFTPVNSGGEIPNIERELRSNLTIAEKVIKEKLQGLVGKVMVLWNKGE